MDSIEYIDHAHEANAMGRPECDCAECAHWRARQPRSADSGHAVGSARLLDSTGGRCVVGVIQATGFDREPTTTLILDDGSELEFATRWIRQRSPDQALVEWPKRIEAAPGSLDIRYLDEERRP